MSRQHATPILISNNQAVSLAPLSLGGGPDAVSEAEIQQLIQKHPSCLPIAEIDSMFCGPVPICTELNTTAGPIDNFMVTPSGLPVLVECKLWRNPEGRREVVGQILDYAKELSRWSASDLQREVSRRCKRPGNAMLDLLREAGHDIDEVQFNDSLTFNLRRGRFLLLIVGDGIREAVESISEYLQLHAGLHFSLGLVELPIYVTPEGDRFVCPRVLARTHVVTRTVVAVPDGYTVDAGGGELAEADNELDEAALDRVQFWTDFLRGLRLDDPEQSLPKVSKKGFVWVSMPVPAGTAWITIFRTVKDGRVGIFLSYTRSTIGERVVRAVVQDWKAIQQELGGTVTLFDDNLGRPLIHDSLVVGSFTEPRNNERALNWLRRRLNDFVNVLRPRVKAAAADLAED